MTGFDRREVHLSIPVAPDMEIAATAQVTALGELLDMARDKIDEMKMAVVEACINAFEHSGTPDRRVDLEFILDEFDGRAFLQIGVCDGGRGFDPAKIPQPDIVSKMKSGTKRGWGLKIIESLMDDVKIESNAHGTKILMRKYRS